jgi:hypothetical protein
MAMEQDDPKAWAALAAASEMATYLRDGAEQTWDHKPVEAVKLLHQIAAGVQALQSGAAQVDVVALADALGKNQAFASNLADALLSQCRPAPDQRLAPCRTCR